MGKKSITPFSKRNQPPPATLSYDIPHKVRKRLLATMKHLTSGLIISYYEVMLSELNRLIDRRHGDRYYFPEHPSIESSAVDHFNGCPPDLLIDLIEWFFQMSVYSRKQEGVDEINEVFRQEGIGYEFSPWSEKNTYLQVPGTPHRVMQTEILAYPLATKKSNELVHNEMVMPTLQLLSGEKWKAANEQMLAAQGHFLRGDFRATIFECAATFETVLKTICKEKRWTYREDKDTLKPLLDACKIGGLIDDFYADPILLTAGIIRNRLGGHGREPTPTYTATAAHAEHMIHLTCSHILFVVKQAGMR